MSDDGQHVVVVTNDGNVWIWEHSLGKNFRNTKVTSTNIAEESAVGVHTGTWPGEGAGATGAGRWYQLPISNNAAEGISNFRPSSEPLSSSHPRISFWTACFFSNTVCYCLGVIIYVLISPLGPWKVCALNIHRSHITFSCHD